MDHGCASAQSNWLTAIEARFFDSPQELGAEARAKSLPDFAFLCHSEAEPEWN